ncbi:MAG: DUF1499 domain-containing protein [Desulfobacteraceae bacterium]|nr:DUF1499 domain-containing protein [Desulfobacteraceae bacterium]
MKISLLICIFGFVMPLLTACASASGPFKPGPLRKCPDSPNCVSSADDRSTHQVAPLTYQGDWLSARQRLEKLLGQIPRTQVKEVNERYLRAECRSRIFGFVDDLEFYFDPAQPLIQVRSASRTGYSDLGVNRKRVEMIRRMWEKVKG